MRAFLFAAACLAAAPAPGALSVGQAVERVESIPLRRGYYVASDTPCGDASNATTTLFKGDGFYATCTTRSIERTAPDTYRLNETCSDRGEPERDSTQTIRVTSDMGFAVVADDGSTWSARFCRQQDMPEPFSKNDLSDLVG